MKSNILLFLKEIFSFSDIEAIERLAILRLTFYIILAMIVSWVIIEIIKTI